MFIPHIPPELILRWLMKLRLNRHFQLIGRIFILTLLTLTAIACAGDWGKAFEPNSLACVIGKVACYQGEPFGLMEYVYKFGAPEYLLAIPMLALCSALMLLFKPPRMYLSVFALSLISFLILVFRGEPKVILNYDTGAGNSLLDLSVPFTLIFSMTLAVNEHAVRKYGANLTL